jgi:hypothetical protein
MPQRTRILVVLHPGNRLPLSYSGRNYQFDVLHFCCGKQIWSTIQHSCHNQLHEIHELKVSSSAMHKVWWKTHICPGSRQKTPVLFSILWTSQSWGAIVLFRGDISCDVLHEMTVFLRHCSHTAMSRYPNFVSLVDISRCAASAVRIPVWSAYIFSQIKPTLSSVYSPRLLDT